MSQTRTVLRTWLLATAVLVASCTTSPSPAALACETARSVAAGFPRILAAADHASGERVLDELLDDLSTLEHRAAELDGEPGEELRRFQQFMSAVLDSQRAVSEEEVDAFFGQDLDLYAVCADEGVTVEPDPVASYRRDG